MLWGAEELGLVGSYDYVDNLSAEDLARIAMYLNFDMTTSPNIGYLVYDGDDSDAVGEGPCPEVSATIEKAFEAFYAARGKTTRGTDFDGRSDCGPFILNGIAAGGLFSGAEDLKSAEEVALWDGAAGVPYDPCYHLACDGMANLDLAASFQGCSQSDAHDCLFDIDEDGAQHRPPFKLIHFADTITKLGAAAEGSVVISGSHGGVYPGYLAARARVRAVVLNDAGVGKDEAGIGSLAYLQAAGVAAAVVSHRSCRIGNTGDMAQRGVISHCNALAAACGVRAGMPCTTAAEHLEHAAVSTEVPPAAHEGRTVPPLSGTRALVLIDSASLVEPEDAGRIVVTGSHGGLIGGIAAKALAVEAWAAVFHDAGIGIDDAGITRLPALDARGIAALTAAGASARIGDAHSILNDGVVSFANETAVRRGARIGEPIADVIARWRTAL